MASVQDTTLSLQLWRLSLANEFTRSASALSTDVEIASFPHPPNYENQATDDAAGIPAL